MENDVSEAPVKMTAAAMIAHFKREEPETFPVHLLTGPVIFRVPANADEFAALRMRATQFAKKMTENPPETWEKLAGKESARQAFWVSALAVDPVIEQKDAVEMAATCQGLIPILHGHIMEKIGSAVVEAEEEALDELGEQSGQIPSGETTSP